MYQANTLNELPQIRSRFFILNFHWQFPILRISPPPPFLQSKMCKAKSLRCSIYLFLAYVWFLQPCYSQESQDSLLQVLESTVDAERVPILNKLLLRARGKNSDQAVSYGKEALRTLEQFPDDSLRNISTYLLGTAFMGKARYDTVLVLAAESKALSESLQDTSQLARSILLIGDAHFRKSDNTLSLKEVSHAMELFSQLNDSSGIAMCALTLGNLNSRLGNYDTAITHYQQAESIRRKQQSEIMVAMIISNTGVAYRRKGDYKEALNHYAEALEIFESLNNDQRVSSTLTNLGVISLLLGNHEDALDFHKRALTLNEKMGRSGPTAASLSNIAAVHSQLGNFETALQFNQRSLSISQETGNRSGIASSLHNVGHVHLNQGHFEEALSFFQQSLATRKDLGNPEQIVKTLHNLVEVHSELEDETQAFLNANEALSTSLEIGNVALIRDSHKHLATLLERSGQHKEALEAYKKYKIAEDSLFNTDSQAIISEIQSRYQTKEQQQTIQILEQEQAIQQLWMSGLIGGLVLFGAVAFLGYNGYRIKKRALGELGKAHNQLKSTQARLIQQEKLASLGQITSGIAHEIKNPLNFVNNFSLINQDLINELVEQEESKIKDQHELIGDIIKNQSRILHHGKRVNQIVQSMMEHAHDAPAKLEKVEINALVKKYLDIAHRGIQVRYPGLEVNIVKNFAEHLDETQLVPQDIGKVIVNLILNAVDATQENPTSSEPEISVTTLQDVDNLIVRIVDNGSGMPAAVKEKIFDPFFTTKEPGKGTGLGLSISYDIVTKAHGGKLNVESEEGKGATFSMVLPKV